MATEITERPQPGQKTALITGTGVGGIGGALATELHRQGYFVFCAVRRPDSITELLRPGMAVVKLEVTDTASVEAAAAEVAAVTGGTLDVLVNNAGVVKHRPALDSDIDGDVRHVFDVNVLGPMRVVQAFGKQLIAAKGCVVNIGSIAPVVPLAFSSSYNSTKAALHAYGDALSMEMKPFGVDVVTVVTGGVKSNITRGNPSLPADSLYMPIEKFWRNRTQISNSDESMATDVYARTVVRMIQSKKRPLRFWAGAKSTLAWFLAMFVPLRWRLYLMAKRFGLLTLGKPAK
ncbi:short chain dehydrogenase/reductase [Cordyceps fumosorosea ARSEF 2679]|uniref:Short chain dehydrogenase/reductase n=1 Tax=Cordyceps fumosorosea (strain ARSEF 2679) TaxID=1081104 RepID=A0A167TQS1_CORFA|nr:short chain dehydrogenase/reductase [Cordyceps fumosorosea ARSEF 2679]OAA60849.1 short chain dehydrogenase/reductase [Cordyceps fumosorosea ARSEF 2679]